MNSRRTRRALTTRSPTRERTQRHRDNTFSFDDSFVLVFTSPPKLSVQVLDETQPVRTPLIKKLMLGVVVLYQGISMLFKVKGFRP